jgi:hypothetical protein
LTMEWPPERDVRTFAGQSRVVAAPATTSSSPAPSGRLDTGEAIGRVGVGSRVRRAFAVAVLGVGALLVARRWAELSAIFGRLSWPW